jgi:hypothetical protein
MVARTLLLLFVSGLCSTSLADEPQKQKLALMPEVRLGKRQPLTKEKTAHIKSLIAKLADVDRPDVGYCQTFGGLAFLPVPGHIQEDSWTWTNHNVKSAATLRELVTAGPDALPFLLDSLGYQTPTKLQFVHGNPDDIISSGKTWFSDELPGSRFNPREAGVIDPPNKKWKEHTNHIDKYQVRIGDLCFVAIGQIVGRPYLAARYQMTSCTVINSPVEDPALRERVRKIWASDNPTQTLFDSLWIDYRTPYGGYQCGAALRLLYYFPAETTSIIVARLKDMDVKKTKEGSDEFTRQAIANGSVRKDDFINAVAWCEEPTIRKAVRDIFRRTTDVGVFISCLKSFGKDDFEWIVQRGNELIEGLTEEEKKEDAQNVILSAMAEQVGEVAAPTFRKFMAKATPSELGLLAGSLSKTRGQWPIAMLKPLLDDKRPTSRNYYVRDPNWNGPRPGPSTVDDGYLRIPVRVCDAAAESLSEILRDKQFTFPDKHDTSTLDRFIVALKAKVAAKP